MDKEDLQKAYLDLEKKAFLLAKESNLQLIWVVPKKSHIITNWFAKIGMKVEICIQKVDLINMEKMAQSFYLNSWMKLKTKNKVY